MRSLSDIYEQSHFVFLSYHPTNFGKAMKEQVWVEAMNEEIDAIEKNKTWTLVDLCAGKNNIGVQRVYKTKMNEKGQVENHKARLVARGFAQ